MIAPLGKREIFLIEILYYTLYVIRITCQALSVD